MSFAKRLSLFQCKRACYSIYAMPRDPATTWDYKAFQGKVTVNLQIPEPKEKYGYTTSELLSILGKSNFQQYEKTSRRNTLTYIKPHTYYHKCDVEGFLRNVANKFYVKNE